MQRSQLCPASRVNCVTDCGNAVPFSIFCIVCCVCCPAFHQADVTVSELVRVVGKAMLLHLPQLVQQPGFSALWVAVLNSLAAAAAAGPEGLNDASAAALQNLIIMLHEMVSGSGTVGGVGCCLQDVEQRACACSLLTMLPCPHSHLLCHTSSKHGTTGLALVIRAGFVFSGGETSSISTCPP